MKEISDQMTDKLHIKKEAEKALKPGSEELYPGAINTEEQRAALNVEDPWLKHPTDNIQIKTSCKEDEDFTLLSDPAWNYLNEIYGGSDIPRYSIQMASDSDDTEDKDYQVEVYY